MKPITVEQVFTSEEEEAWKELAGKKDTINPDHYKQGDVECIEALASATINLKGIEAVCTANAIKYLWRWKEKGGADDLRKAQWYITRLLTQLPKL
jgi:hypothetical protein